MTAPHWLGARARVLRGRGRAPGSNAVMERKDELWAALSRMKKEQESRANNGQMGVCVHRSA